LAERQPTPYTTKGRAFAMPNDSTGVMDTWVSSTKEALKGLEAREAELAGELAKVRAQRKSMAKSLDAVTGAAPRRRRRRATAPAE
jgi:hypothetical protein